MKTRLIPTVGQWYAHRDKGQPFQVVAVDDDGSVEMQDVDGDVDEIDRESWYALPIEVTDEPDSGVSLLSEDDDAMEDGLATEGADWRQPLDSFSPQPQESVETDDDGPRN